MGRVSDVARYASRISAFLLHSWVYTYAYQCTSRVFMSIYAHLYWIFDRAHFGQLYYVFLYVLHPDTSDPIWISGTINSSHSNSLTSATKSIKQSPNNLRTISKRKREPKTRANPYQHTMTVDTLNNTNIIKIFKIIIWRTKLFICSNFY